MFTVMPLFGPERTELPCLAVFGPFPVDAEASSWLCCSSSLTSTPSPDFSPLPSDSPCILAFSKLCILGPGTVAFPEVTVFDEISLF